jgi:hypothetical protein
MQITVDCEQPQAYKYGAFREAFIHIESLSGPCRWPDDASLRIEGCGGFRGICTMDSNTNFTRMKAPLDLSMRRFQRSFYTHRVPFWPAPVVRRCFVENRRVWRLWQFGWRCEFHSIECTLESINKALSAKVLYI